MHFERRRDLRPLSSGRKNKWHEIWRGILDIVGITIIASSYVIVSPILLLYAPILSVLFFEKTKKARACKESFTYYETFSVTGAKRPKCEAADDPPALAEFLIGCIAKERYRRGLLHCLDADFREDLKVGMSISRARRRYWAAATRAIWPQIWSALKRIGFIGALAAAARRHLP